MEEYSWRGYYVGCFVLRLGRFLECGTWSGRGCEVLSVEVGSLLFLSERESGRGCEVLSVEVGSRLS